MADLKAVEKQLELLIKKPDTLATFPGLPNDPEIEQKLDRVRAELKEAQSKEVILKRAIPKEISLPSVVREAVAHFLEKSSDEIATNVAEAVT